MTAEAQHKEARQLFASALREALMVSEAFGDYFPGHILQRALDRADEALNVARATWLVMERS